MDHGRHEQQETPGCLNKKEVEGRTRLLSSNGRGKGTGIFKDMSWRRQPKKTNEREKKKEKKRLKTKVGGCKEGRITMEGRVTMLHC